MAATVRVLQRYRGRRGKRANKVAQGHELRGRREKSRHADTIHRPPPVELKFLGRSHFRVLGRWEMEEGAREQEKPHLTYSCRGRRRRRRPSLWGGMREGPPHSCHVVRGGRGDPPGQGIYRTWWRGVGARGGRGIGKEGTDLGDGSSRGNQKERHAGMTFLFIMYDCILKEVFFLISSRIWSISSGCPFQRPLSRILCPPASGVIVFLLLSRG